MLFLFYNVSKSGGQIQCVLNTYWIKILSDFEVTMRSFNEAETPEFVRLFLLPQLKHLNIDVGLL